MPSASWLQRPRLWIAAAVLLALAGAWAWSSLRPQPASAVRVQSAPLVRTLQFTARVATDSRVELGATVTGRVEAVRVREGDRVEAGQLLVQLEQPELRAALAQAQASERQAAARLAGLRSTGRQALQAAVAQAEAQWRNARAEWARNEQLVAQGFVSEARLDDARRAVAVAAAQLDAARAQAGAAADRGTDTAQAQAQLELARAAVQAAQARLAQTRVLAPTAGRVLRRQVEPGQIVQPGRALLVLALEGPRQLVALVDERFLEQLRVGQTATAVADAFPGQRFPARVSSLAPSVDAQRGAIEVKLSLPPDPPPFLREDLTVSVEVETGRREQALVMPLAALRGADTAWVARDGRVQARKLRLGLRTLDAAEVLDGLSAGDLVLMGPAPAPGRRVHAEPVPWQPGNDALPESPGGGAAAALSNSMGR
ncbi:efflux RND transporter periplasmic adaptor subunit [Ramlibacter sp. AW1]|uniref:Efflux RND transporter periplasmic adaptor subunit n=1 Tax=Ramlibacter aurantiacus TaxID=2801330 RepID=A0A937D857_9BURK|nr:efflux RND transporter periplasmic adaptor subunit [Ramlibacter aurantiacus]MBL0421701.1 efflux RND transporter periplasmic adaptor subunit [Ramlibacter aurantiacus]